MALKLHPWGIINDALNLLYAEFIKIEVKQIPLTTDTGF